MKDSELDAIRQRCAEMESRGWLPLFDGKPPEPTVQLATAKARALCDEIDQLKRRAEKAEGRLEAHDQRDWRQGGWKTYAEFVAHEGHWDVAKQVWMTAYYQVESSAANAKLSALQLKMASQRRRFDQLVTSARGLRRQRNHLAHQRDALRDEITRLTRDRVSGESPMIVHPWEAESERSTIE